VIGRAAVAPIRTSRRTAMAGLAMVALALVIGACCAGGPRVAAIALAVVAGIALVIAIQRHPEVGVIAAVAAMPFAQHPWWELNITASDMIVVLTFLAWLLTRAAWQRQSVRVTPGLCLYGLFVLAAGVSLLFPFNPREGLPNLIELVFFALLYLLILNTIDTPGKVWLVIGGWFLGVLVAAGYGLYHYVLGTATTEFLALNARRIVGTHMDPNFFGSLLAASVVLCMALWWRARQPSARLAVMAGLALLGAVLVLTLSRGAIAGVAAGLLALVVMSPRRLRVALALGCALMVGWAVRLPDYKSEHSVWSMRERLEHAAMRGDPNRMNRLYGIYIAAVLFSKHPLVGSGLETYRDRMTPFSSRFSLRPAHSCHTVPALVLAETGAIGFLLLNAFVLVVLIRVIRLARASPHAEVGILARHIAVALVVLLVVGLSIDVLYSRFFWIAFAVADSLVLAHERSAREREPTEEDGQ